MTKRYLLTDQRIRKIDQPGTYLDGQGLYLQVTAALSKSWLLRYRFAGVPREAGLGSFNLYGLAKARELAQDFRRKAAVGIDPINERREARAVLAAQLLEQRANKGQSVPVPEVRTLRLCAEECHRVVAEDFKNPKHINQWINTLNAYVLPLLGDKPVEAIDKADIIQVLRPIWQKKAETASRVMQRLRKVLNYAAAHDYRPSIDSEVWAQIELALGSNDGARIAKHHEACPYDKVAEVVAQVRGCNATPMVKLAFEYIVLTAARSGEGRGARESELDLSKAEWVIPGERMKAGREHRVPLSHRAVEIILEARDVRPPVPEPSIASKDGLVFSNPKGVAYSDMVFTQLLRRLELPYTMHGFRATFRTWAMEKTDYPDDMLEMALAHTVGDATVRAYARGAMVAKRRQLMEDWSAFIASEQFSAPLKPS